MEGLKKTSFNSRPHKEVDVSGSTITFPIYLSTHDLTRRSTVKNWGKITDWFLSTHDLTRRSTTDIVFDGDNRFLSTHDLTRRSTAFILSDASI